MELVLKKKGFHPILYNDAYVMYIQIGILVIGKKRIA